MRKVLLVAVLTLLVAVAANAQLKFGVKAGVSFAGINDSKTNIKAGIAAGILGQLKLSEKWAIQPEVLFSMQGAKYKSGSTKTDWKLSYIAAPIMAQLYIIKGLNVELGPQFGFLLSSKRNGADMKAYTKSFELAVGAGAAYQLPSLPVGFSARYTFGVTELSKTAALGTNLRNYAVQLGAFVKF